jgi:hypothetical protein
MVSTNSRIRIILLILLAPIVGYIAYSHIAWGGMWVPMEGAGAGEGFYLITAPEEVRATHGHVLVDGKYQHGSKINGNAGSDGVLLDTSERINNHSRACDQWGNFSDAGQKTWRFNPDKFGWTYDSNGVDEGCGNEFLGFSGTRHAVDEAPEGIGNNFGPISKHTN